MLIYEKKKKCLNETGFGVIDLLATVEVKNISKIKLSLFNP